MEEGRAWERVVFLMSELKIVCCGVKRDFVSINVDAN